MKLLRGSSDQKRVADYSNDELYDEALRLSNNLAMTGMDYTAAVLQRLVDDLSAIYGYGVKDER